MIAGQDFGWTDSQIIAELDSNVVSGLYPYHFFTGMQPLYKWNCPIPASDIVYMDGRLWAIGDPELPWRMYWTNVNSPPGYAFSSWRPGNVYDFVDDGYGALIALEEAAGGDAFYAFKRNAIYFVTPGPQVHLIESNVGPVSANAIVRYKDQIYFLASDMRIYMVYGANPPIDVSDPIRNHIDSIFVDRHIAYRKCRAFRLNDGLKFFNDSTKKGLNFNADRGQWSIEIYGQQAISPHGSFQFDTTEYSRFAWGDYGISVIYINDPTALMVESDSAFDSTSTTKIEFNSSVRFPFFGDGEHLWMIKSVDLSVHGNTSDDTLHYQIRGHNYNVIAGTPFDFTCNTTDGSCYTYPVPHKDRFVSFELMSEADYAVSDDIYDKLFLDQIIITYQNMGGVNVR